MNDLFITKTCCYPALFGSSYVECNPISGQISEADQLIGEISHQPGDGGWREEQPVVRHQPIEIYRGMPGPPCLS